MDSTKEENDYFTRYRNYIRRKVVDCCSESDEKERREKFWEYLESSYNYTKEKKGKMQDQYFDSENDLLHIGFLLTCGNAVVSALSACASCKIITVIASVCVTGLSAFLTYKQAVITKKKYHETWMRHSEHYILQNKECRDFAEGFGVYDNLLEEDAAKLFVKRIYEIDDQDLDAFLNNTKKLDKMV